MRILIAGLVNRGAINLVSFLLAVIAIASAMVGPAYSRASAEYLLDSRISQRLPSATGLTFAVPAEQPGVLPKGSADNYTPPPPLSLTKQAAERLDQPNIDRFWLAATPWLADGGGSLTANGQDFTAPLYWRQGMCDLARVKGRCPGKPGEALINPATANALGLQLGDTLTLSFTRQWMATGAETKQETVQRDFGIVGTYQAAGISSPAWYDQYRFSGDARLTGLQSGGGTPLAPALLVAPGSMVSQTFVGGVDRPIDTAAVNLATLQRAQSIGNHYFNQLSPVSEVTASSPLDLAPLVREVRSEQSTLNQVTLAAVAPLVVLGLLLLHALVSIGSQARRPQLTVARLRGQSTGQVFRLAMGEPVVVIVLASPVAWAVARLASEVLANVWLGQRVPASLPTSSIVAGLVVLAAAALSAAAAVISVVREPLSSSLGSGIPSVRSSRAVLVLRSALVALAVAAFVQVTGSGGNAKGGLSNLLAPLLFALGAAVLAVVAVPVLARRWLRGTGRQPGSASYIASRQVARGGRLGTLVTPLLLAASVTTFAASSWVVAGDLRLSRAEADVGASRIYQTSVGPDRLLHVTHRVDPEGDHLAAVVIGAGGDETGRQLLIDVSRLEAVAAWNPSWSGISVSQLQHSLSPAGAKPPIEFTGRQLTFDLNDVKLHANSDKPVELHVKYLDDRGTSTDVVVGTIHEGTLSTAIDGCAKPCILQQLYVSRTQSSVTNAQGSFTIAAVSADGDALDWRLSAPRGWRAARPFPVSPVDPPVRLRATGQGLRVQLFLDHLPPRPGGAPPTMISGVARFSPTDLVEVLPVLVAGHTKTPPMPGPTSALGRTYGDEVVAAKSLTGGQFPVHPVARVRALPGLGNVGILLDLSAALREGDISLNQVLTVQLWIAPDTPASMVTQVRKAGVYLYGSRTVADEVRASAADAFSLGWRIFLVVGTLTILLALFGTLFAGIAQRRSRAYELASLQLIGVKTRDLMRASIFEHASIIAFSVVIGMAAGCLALVTVLPHMDLGVSGPYGPPADYAIRWTIVGAVATTTFVVTTVAALWTSAKTLRTSAPEALPWADER